MLSEAPPSDIALGDEEMLLIMELAGWTLRDSVINRAFMEVYMPTGAVQIFSKETRGGIPVVRRAFDHFLNFTEAHQ